MKKRMKTLTTFLAGALCAVMVISITVPSFAVDAWKTISVMTGINVYVDDVKVNPTDANGKPVDVLLYDGTTYLPVRAVSQALGQNVAWDGKTQSVFVGQHAADHQPAFPLYDLDYFTSSHLHQIYHRTVADNLGNNHDTTVIEADSSKCSITYKTNGKYSAMTGVFFLKYGERSSGTEYHLAFYGDGRQLWSETVQSGVEPIPFNVDLTGVNTLVIEASNRFVNSNTVRLNYEITLGDTMLFT